MKALCFIFGLAALLGLACNLHAAALVVTNTADSGPGSLRATVAAAGAGSTITFAGALSSQTITLTNGLISLTNSVTIDASALPGGIQINGNGSFTIFNVASGANAVLNSLTLINGYTSGNGGGINNAGTATLNECTLSGNNAAGNGGGINNAGTAILNECTLSGNTAYMGGGIDSTDVVVLNECTLSGNSGYAAGGGVYNSGTLAITNSIDARNIANAGGDIYSTATVDYGGVNLVQSVVNSGGAVIGPAPVNAAPNLASLGNYGGPTPTLPPLPGSPAIGAGSIAVNTFTNDQRQYARTQNGRIDIGAVELPTFQSFAASPTYGMSPISVQFNAPGVDSDGSAITQWNWTYGDGTTGAGQNTNHVYSTGGMFSPGLLVTNILGLTLAVTGPNIYVDPLVNSTADSGPNTLRSAIANAFGGETITFATNLSGATITLASPLRINLNLTVDASALPSGIQINGNGAFTVFSVATNIAVLLDALTITNGYIAGYGGGISNIGTLTLDQCTLSGNRAANGYGGGIFNEGAVTLNQCTLWGNNAGNVGGGLFNMGGTATLNECTLSGNSAGGAGGGIYIDAGTVAITNTIVAGNTGSIGTDIYSLANLNYGGTNLVHSFGNNGGKTSGPSPLSAVPALAPLGNYGGPNETLPPGPGSPAIGAGSTNANLFATDQRGYARTQNGRIDIGAVELPTVQPFTASTNYGYAPLSVQLGSTNADSDGSAIVQWNWNFGDGTNGVGQNTNHVYNTPGMFSPGLIVTNSLGLALAASGPGISVGPLVTNGADSGPGSLRSAIANAINGGIITFATNLSGSTITLANTLVINTNLTLDASALPRSIQVNGNGAVTVLSVASNTVVTLNSLTFTNGYASYGGGGLTIYGTATLNQCTLSGNGAYDVGGGINNYGMATLNQCTLSGNSSYWGGGIYNYGTVKLNECTVSGDIAGENGGGIVNNDNALLALNQCTLSGNSVGAYGSGGGIYNSGTLAMTNSIVAGNSGGFGADLTLEAGALIYGGANLVQSVDDGVSTIMGPAPLDAAPNLAPLGNYGGPTQTMPPEPGSPAIGDGRVAANTFATDQRGYGRTQNGLIDIGAVELPTVQFFTANPDYGIPPLIVQFDATNVDSDGAAITQWNWNFGDGTSGLGQNITHVYSTLGTFFPGLIVTNSLGVALPVFGPPVTVVTGPFVSNNIDGGTGTLRLAITSDTNGNTITFAPNMSGATITLAGTLAINANLTIDASTLPGGVQINGNGAATIFNVAAGVTDVLDSLTITNGHANGNGGGIDNHGTLTLNECALLGDTANSGNGGGIDNNGALTLNECTVSGNSASNLGGGVCNDAGALALTVNACTLSGNSALQGGGICVSSGSLALNNAIVAGNSGGSGADITLQAGSLNYGGANLVQLIDNSGGAVNGPAPVNAAPNLAPLGNYGGPTPTIPPLPGSSVIGAGSVSANMFATDERGYPRMQNGLIEIGAVELPTVPPFTANPARGFIPLNVQFSGTNVDSDGTAIVQWNWNFGDGTSGTGQHTNDVYYTTNTYLPSLIVTNSLGLALAVTGPAVTGFLAPVTLTGSSVSGTNLTISGTGGVPGVTYYVLTSSNVALPFSQWTPLATNTWNAFGPFSFTLTNFLNPPAPVRFYLLDAP